MKIKLARPTALLRQESPRVWYKITNKAATTAELFIYDEIGYWGVSANDLVNDLRQLNVNTIELRLNSPGGEVFDGMAIYNALRDHKATINVTVDGLAASAASFIAMAGDTIKMNRGSQMMIHDAMSIVAGNANDMRDMATMLDRSSDQIAALYAEAAGARGQSSSVTYWRAQMQAESWYDPTEAVKAGLADEAVAGTDSSAHTAAWDLSIFATRPRVTVPAPANMVPPIVVDDPSPEPGPDPQPPERTTSFDADAFKASMQGFGDSLRPPVIEFDTDVFKAAIDMVVNDTPDQPAPQPAPEPEYRPVINPQDFERYLREARV